MLKKKYFHYSHLWSSMWYCKYGTLSSTYRVCGEINSNSSDKAILQGKRCHLFYYPEHQHVNWTWTKDTFTACLAQMLVINQCDNANTLAGCFASVILASLLILVQSVLNMIFFLYLLCIKIRNNEQYSFSWVSCMQRMSHDIWSFL